ncbi:MAG: VOC family protein [Bacteroidota bacterium]
MNFIISFHHEEIHYFTNSRGLFLSCVTEKSNESLIAFNVYCEMVANGAKPLALHYPMTPEEVGGLWEEFAGIAEKYDVQLYREDDFPTSALFPAEATRGKSVVLIYKRDRLKQYEQWKRDRQNAEDDPMEQEALARRFGRLLGYSTQGINDLLGKNTAYRNLVSFGVKKQLTHLYYENLSEAIDFYHRIIGFDQVDSGLFQISTDTYIHLHGLTDDHPKGEAKSTAIAFLTDQLPQWYAHIQEKKVPIKYTYKPREGGPHDGFVAIDPGGYLLEFEQFKQHPENELFMAILAEAPRIETSVPDLNFYGSITWTYHKDVVKMQKFYEELLGYQLVADQGWTKIYQTSSTGFIGLVDERRGMENYAEGKAVEIEWLVTEWASFDEYATAYWSEFNYEGNTFIGPENYIYHVHGNDL